MWHLTRGVKNRFFTTEKFLSPQNTYKKWKGEGVWQDPEQYWYNSHLSLLRVYIKIFQKLRITGVVSKFCYPTYHVFNTTGDSILIKFISLDLPRWEDSNDSCFAFLASILTDLCHKMYFYFSIQSSLVSCISIVQGPVSLF